MKEGATLLKEGNFLDQVSNILSGHSNSKFRSYQCCSFQLSQEYQKGGVYLSSQRIWDTFHAKVLMKRASPGHVESLPISLHYIVTKVSTKTNLSLCIYHHMLLNKPLFKTQKKKKKKNKCPRSFA